MTMPSSGALNMGGTSSPVSVAQELGLSLTATISMNDAAVRTLAGVGGSGTSWSMNSLYGKSNGYTIEYLIVAGGGPGGYNTYGFSSGGGGGGGGYIASSSLVSTGTALAAVVGAGMNAGSGVRGNDSSFNASTAIGGGSGVNGTATGGSAVGGFGQAYSNLPSYGPGGYTAGQGNAGGSMTQGYNGITSAGAGGGGGGAAGANSQNQYAVGGNGGNGYTWSNGVVYAGGGGGGTYSNYYAGFGGSPGAGGTGGAGGGGRQGYDDYGDSYYTLAGNGAANLGGGGGGGPPNAPGSSGSGVVIIRYAGSQRGTGGTVTSAGGYTYHTFTTSGTYTA